jgi:hypothetical protein
VSSVSFIPDFLSSAAILSFIPGFFFSVVIQVSGLIVTVVYLAATMVFFFAVASRVVFVRFGDLFGCFGPSLLIEFFGLHWN